MRGRRALWRGRKVLVTGSTGYLGEAVTRELLSLDAEVIAFVERHTPLSASFTSIERLASEYDDKRLHVKYGRVEDTCALYTAIAIHEVTVIFHLADYAGEPEKHATRPGTYEDDCGIAAVMRAAALRHKLLPVIAARPSSQLRVMGSDPGGTTPHGIARFEELFGAGDRELTHRVPKLITTLLAGKRPSMPESPARDYVYVRDAARACLAVAEAVGTGSTRVEAGFHSGWRWTDAEFTQLLSECLAGRPSSFRSLQTPDNPLGWKPEVAVPTALFQTLAWYQESAALHPANTSSPEFSRKAA